MSIFKNRFWCVAPHSQHRTDRHAQARTGSWRCHGAGLLLAGCAWLVTLSGCDEHKLAKLQEGVSTEADVMREFGAPQDIQRAADGARTFEYTRQPEGSTNYFITIDPQGKLQSVKQVLQPRYFEQVTQGMSAAEVRRLLGQPASKQAYALKKEEVWDWRWMEGQTRKVFRVTYDYNGVVQNTATLNDPRDLETGGR